MRTTRALFWLLCIISSSAAADKGVVEFSTKAAPPTEQDKVQAAAWSSRSKELVSQIDRLGTALRSTIGLAERIDTTTVVPKQKAVELSAKFESWRSAFKKIFERSKEPVLVAHPETFTSAVPAPAYRWKISESGIKDYVIATIGLAGSLTKPQPEDQTITLDTVTLKPEIAAMVSEQAKWLDELIAEHAVLNDQMRLYPYSALQPQSTIPCTSINAYSNNFKCFPRTQTGTVEDATWLFDRKIDLKEFCVVDRAASFPSNDRGTMKMLVRKTKLSETPSEGLQDAQVEAPQSRLRLDPDC